MKKVGVKATRPVLAEYTLEFLRSALTLSATVVVTGYCLWAFDTSSTGLSSTYNDFVPIRLTVVPVVFAVLFIMRSADAGDSAAPEDLLLHNRTVQALALIWVALLRGESTDESRHALRLGSYVAQRRHFGRRVERIGDCHRIGFVASHHRAGLGAATVTPPR